MNTRQTDFLNGYVMGKITEHLAVDKDRLIEDLVDDLSNLFEDKSQAEKLITRAVKQLESMGFIEVNGANNVTQDNPVDAFRDNIDTRGDPD